MKTFNQDLSKKIVHCIRNIKDEELEGWGQLINAKSGKFYRPNRNRLIVLKNGVFPYNPKSKSDDSFSGTWFYPKWMGERYPDIKDLIEEGVDTYDVTRVEIQTELWDSLPQTTKTDLSDLVKKIYLIDRLFDPDEQAKYTKFMNKFKKKKRKRKNTMCQQDKRKKRG